MTDTPSSVVPIQGRHLGGPTLHVVRRHVLVFVHSTIGDIENLIQSLPVVPLSGADA